MREGSHEADLAACHYVQRQRVVYHRLFGQDETRLRQRYVGEAGSNGKRQYKNARPVRQRRHRFYRDTVVVSHCAGDNRLDPDEQREHIR